MPCPKCGRPYTWDGSRCCNTFCRHGSALEPKTDFREVRRQRFMANGGKPAVALWTPSWYSLDPPLLEVGLTTEFYFCDTGEAETEPLVMYAGSGNGFWVAAWGTIGNIRHPDFGDVRSANMRGLDYRITLLNGRLLVINAEESPGQIHEQVGDEWAESSLVVRNWQFTLEFTALGDRESVDRQL